LPPMRKPGLTWKPPLQLYVYHIGISVRHLEPVRTTPPRYSTGSRRRIRPPTIPTLHLGKKISWQPSGVGLTIRSNTSRTFGEHHGERTQLPLPTPLSQDPSEKPPAPPTSAGEQVSRGPFLILWNRSMLLRPPRSSPSK